MDNKEQNTNIYQPSNSGSTQVGSASPPNSLSKLELESLVQATEKPAVESVNNSATAMLQEDLAIDDDIIANLIHQKANMHEAAQLATPSAGAFSAQLASFFNPAISGITIGANGITLNVSYLGSAEVNVGDLSQFLIDSIAIGINSSNASADIENLANTILGQLESQYGVTWSSDQKAVVLQQIENALWQQFGSPASAAQFSSPSLPSNMATVG